MTKLRDKKHVAGGERNAEGGPGPKPRVRIGAMAERFGPPDPSTIAPFGNKINILANEHRRAAGAGQTGE